MDERRIAERVARSMMAVELGDAIRDFEQSYWEAVYRAKEKAAYELTKKTTDLIEKMAKGLPGYSFVRGAKPKNIAKELVVRTFLGGGDQDWEFENFIRQGEFKLEKDAKVARELIARKKPGIELLTLNKKRLARQLGDKMSDWVYKHTSGWFQGSQAESNAREAMLEFLQRELGRKYDLNDESENETMEFMEDLIIFEWFPKYGSSFIDGYED